MERTLKELYVEYNSLPMSPQRTKIGKLIRTKKKKLVEKKEYVEIIHILKFIGDYEKDDLFIDLLKLHPESSSFVLAFANQSMHSHARAYEIAMHQYENDDAINENVMSIFDEKLCAFLSKYNSKDDCRYVQMLTDGATWLESNKRSLQELLGKFIGTVNLFHSSFLKRTPNIRSYFIYFLIISY